MKRFRPAVWPLVGLVAVTLAILFLAPVVAQERARVGLVDRVEAEVTSNGSTLPAAIGTPIHLGDEMKTGSAGRLQITLRDDTRLTLGEKARLVVDRFVYDPDRKQGGEAVLAEPGVGAMVTSATAQPTAPVTWPQDKVDRAVATVTFR